MLVTVIGGGVARREADDDDAVVDGAETGSSAGGLSWRIGGNKTGDDDP